MRKFERKDLKKLYKPSKDSNGEENGQVTIIGGSKLFHGAPILCLKVAARLCDMVFFSSPEKAMQEVSSYIKADLSSFIWVPWDEIEIYVEKSDAVLIGPGFMRYHKEKGESAFASGLGDECDEACQLTKSVTEKLLSEYPKKKWVIDAGSLQTMDVKFIPENSILTPNKKEFEMLFKLKIQNSKGKITTQNLKVVQERSREHNCIIVLKGPTTYVISKDEVVEVSGGNAGLTKGGTGDVQAGLTASILTKNDPLLAAECGAYIVKATADFLYKRVGTSYNADDLADAIPLVMHGLLKA
jgi:NAD(P)H-hydrate epimerase